MTNENVAARVAGACAVALMLLGPFCLMIVPQRTMGATPAETVLLQVSQASLVRQGHAAELGIVAVELVMTAALWVLFRRDQPGGAVAVAGSRLAMTVLQACTTMAGMAALSSFVDQAPAAGHALLSLRAAGTLVWQGVFGMHCALLTVALLRSAVPRPFGVGMGLAAGAYLLIGFGSLLRPDLQPQLTQGVVPLLAMGEVPLYLWWLVRGQTPSAGRPVPA